MSNPDSFIDEVTEEVRRDNLYRLMRKYGWIAVLLVVLLVGGAAYNEWSKASARAKAETFGDAVLTALSQEDEATRQSALAAIEADGTNAALLSLLSAGAGAASDSAQAANSLKSLAGNSEFPALYRDLAVLKLVTLPGNDMSAADKIAALEPLAVAGLPYRVLAEEQIALAEIEQGQTDAAISRLQTLLVDEETSQALRRRATQLIVALGGAPERS